MNKTSFRSTVCKLAGAVALTLSSGIAMAAHTPGFGLNSTSFTINPSAIGEQGCNGGTCTARFIDFSYGAEVNQTNRNASSALFTETGGGFFGTFRTDLDAAPVPGTGLNASYQMYFLFNAAGTTAPNGAGGINGTFNSFNYTIYVDRDMDTTLTSLGDGDVGDLNGDQTVSASNTGDDIAVLGGSLMPGMGGFHIFQGLAAGDFNVIATATVLSDFFGGDAFAKGGEAYADINGVNSRIRGIPANPFGTANDILINGSGNTSFQPVPEPASLALFGLALAGVACSRRNKKA